MIFFPHSQPADEKCIFIICFIYVTVKICTPVNIDYIHLTWNRTVVRRAINGGRCDAVRRIRQCQSLWESETNVPLHHLDCHFPVRMLIFERERALVKRNALSKKKKPPRCFSFYHFIVRKFSIQYSRCSFVSRSNKCWLTESNDPLVLAKKEKKIAKWKFSFAARILLM